MCVVRPSVLLLYESTLIPCRSWCRRVLLEPLIHLKRYRPGRALLHGVWDESTRKRRKVAIISTMLMDVQLFYIGLEVVIACLAVSGNVLVCWAVCLNSNLQSITNFFLVSLAVADIAVGLLAIPFAITISTGFCANFYGCLFIACFVLVLTQSSIFSLMAVAVDRYIAIKSPLRYSSLVTGQRAKGIIAVCWVLSVGIGLTPMLGWNKGVNNTTNSTCPEGMIKCLFEGVVTLDYMVYFNFFGCVLVPLLVMLAIYARIFMAARRQLRRMELKIFHVPAHREGASSSSGSSRSTLQKEVHAAKSLAIIVGLFALCWLPVHIINCVNLLCPNGRPHIWVMNIAIILSHANSVVNPLIYAYRIQEFRYTFRRIVYQHILCQKDGVGFGVDSGGDRAERTGSIMQTSSRLSVDTVVMNMNALDPSPHHSPPGASHEASKHWTAGSELALISCISNGHHIVDGILSPRLQQPCTTGFAAQDGGESTTYQGQTPGVLEVKDIGSSISFVNVRPLCPTHTSPTYSRELTDVRPLCPTHTSPTYSRELTEVS